MLVEHIEMPMFRHEPVYDTSIYTPWKSLLQVRYANVMLSKSDIEEILLTMFLFLQLLPVCYSVLLLYLCLLLIFDFDCFFFKFVSCCVFFAANKDVYIASANEVTCLPSEYLSITSYRTTQKVVHEFRRIFSRRGMCDWQQDFGSDRDLEAEPDS